MMKNITLSFLGTGGALSNGRFWTSILVNERILLDAAPTSPLSLIKLNKDIRNITHIFITHFHGDHTMGLPFLLLDYAFRYKRNRPLLIIGPSDIEEHTKSITEVVFPGLSETLVEKSMARFFSVSDEGNERTIEGISFLSYKMRHFDMAAYGYRLSVDGSNVAFSGDTGPCENIYRLIKDAHIIILEMNFVNKEFPHHLNVRDIERIRRSALSSQKIIITHLEEETIPSIKDVIISQDLEEYKF